ncbi:MAG: CPBP family intramembrane metalloprotease [Oscillospiraceae bacterium]|nr:CPBP family intramembrane metalloprotease [Oscillospiraceae bacterium]
MEKISDFKTVCFKIGLIMTVFFISRMGCSFAIEFMYRILPDNTSATTLYVGSLVLQDLFLYIIPIIAAVIIMKVKNPLSLYKKPPRIAKALGNFPAMYGLGQLTNYLTLIAVWVFSNFTPDNIELEKSFGSMAAMMPPNFICGIALAVRMIFSAAIYEEFFARGIILKSLKPYGTGFAIMVSGILFGLMHGNFQQLFYATVVGIVLGYIYVQTDSLLIPTILHAVFNSISAVMLLFMSTDTLQNFMMGDFMDGIPDNNMMVMAIFSMFFVLTLGLMIAGMALAFKRIFRFKIYKVTNTWQEVGTGKKAALFFTRIPIILMCVLTIDAFAGSIIFQKIAGFIWGTQT